MKQKREFLKHLKDMRKYYILIFITSLSYLNGFIIDTNIDHVIAGTKFPLIFNKEDSIYSRKSDNLIVSVTVEQELFPVIAKFLSEGVEQSEEDANYTPGAYYDQINKRIVFPTETKKKLSLPHLVNWNIKNNNDDSVKVSIISDIPEWTQPVIATTYLGPNENKKIPQTPFGIRLLDNYSILPTSIFLKVKIGDNTIFEESKKLRIRPANDMIWSLHTAWDTESLIAAWVTPNDESVEQILSSAKERLFNRSLAGYRSSDLLAEIRAIFNAVRNSKVSYVDSHMSFGQVGFTQRVRLPRESIQKKSANCIDGAVLFASLFENIGLEPLIILIPEHAFVGVRLAPNEKEVLFIETTMVGRNVMESILSLTKTFDAAVKKGSDTYQNAIRNNANDVRIIDIKKARTSGIYPLW